MIARGFKPVGWVAAIGGAALGCYMLSLNVAAERADLASLDREIVAAKRDIRDLQTELGTRGRMQQLEHWNAEVLALSAPTSGQFLDSAFTLARFNMPEPSYEERTKVRMASAETAAEEPGQVSPKVVMASAFEPEEAPAHPQAPVVRRASYSTSDSGPLVVGKPMPFKPAAATPAKAKPVKDAGLIDPSLMRQIGEAAKAEKDEGGSDGQ